MTFFKHPVYPYGLKEDSIERLELNSSEKVILCSGDTAATYKLSDISLEFVFIFEKPYVATIGVVCWKKDTTWKIDVNNLSVCSLQGLLLLFLDKRDDFANKKEEF